MTSLERLIQHLECEMNVTLRAADDETTLSLVNDVITSCNFRSSLTLDGEAILPPVVTKQRRAECVTYRHQAVLAEARMRARRKDRLLQKVQDALDSAQETSPRSRIFDPSLNQLGEPHPAPVSKPTVLIPSTKPKSAWPTQQTSAQSPTVQHAKFPSDLQESSSSSGDATMGITQSYMFHSSDSSEYQTTVIARDEDSELKHVAGILREEKRQREAAAQVSPVPVITNNVNRIPDSEVNEKVVHEQDEKVRRKSDESAVSDPGSAPRSKGLSRALGLVKDVVGSSERLHRDSHEHSEDISSTLSSDGLYNTASTDIIQYMKVPLSDVSSSNNTIEADVRTSTATSERTITEETRVMEITGAEMGESSTDAGKRSTEHGSSRQGKHEHLKRYLQQLGAQPLLNSGSQLNSSGSQTSELNSTGNSQRQDVDVGYSVSMQDLQQVGRSGMQDVQQVGRSRQSDVSASVNEEELLRYQVQQCSDKRRSLERQQRLQLEKLLHEQRREKERLEYEIVEQEERLRRAQSALYAPGMSQESPRSFIPPHAEALIRQDVMTDSDPDDSPRGVPFIDRASVRTSDRYHPDNRHSYHERTVTPEPVVTGHDSDPETPTRQTSAHRGRRPVVKVPEKALDPAMKPKYDRVSAAVKGYLTRRLLRTEKVRDLIKTIKDTAEFAISFHSEASIKNGIYSMQDLTLQERVIAQLRAALLEVHEIFFDVSIRERMAIIQHSRELERERRYKAGTALRRTMSDTRGKKLSAATQRAMERKKKARVAEQSMQALAEEMRQHRLLHQHDSATRPRTAPSGDHEQNQPHKLKTMDIRALRPIQGQSSPVKPTKPTMDKDSTDRPSTAPAKTARAVTPKDEHSPASRVKRTESGSGGKKQANKTPAGSVPTARLKSVPSQNNNNAASSKLLSKPTMTTVPASSTNRRR